MELKAGLAGVAAPGANRLAAGAAELRNGLDLIDDGASKVAAGNAEAAAGGEELSAGATQLGGGARRARQGPGARLGTETARAGGAGSLPTRAPPGPAVDSSPRVRARPPPVALSWPRGRVPRPTVVPRSPRGRVRRPTAAPRSPKARAPPLTVAPPSRRGRGLLLTAARRSPKARVRRRPVVLSLQPAPVRRRPEVLTGSGSTSSTQARASAERRPRRAVGRRTGPFRGFQQLHRRTGSRLRQPDAGGPACSRSATGSRSSPMPRPAARSRCRRAGSERGGRPASCGHQQPPPVIQRTRTNPANPCGLLEGFRRSRQASTATIPTTPG